MASVTSANKRDKSFREDNKVRVEDQAVHEWYRFVLSFPPHLVRDYLARFAADEYAGAEPECLKGKVAVVLRYEPQDANGTSLWSKQRGEWTNAASVAAKAAQAARRGAVAMPVVSLPAADDGKFDSPSSNPRSSKGAIPVLHITRKAWLRMLKAAGPDSAGTDRKCQQAADDGSSGPSTLALTVLHDGKTRQVEVKLGGAKR